MTAGTLRRTIAASLLLLASLSATAAEEVTIDVAGGRLHGTLEVPADGASVPAVLIIAGSGPTDRDGNQPQLRNDSLKQLADSLAKHGIASLRFDKRGIGASRAAAKQESDLRFDDYVADAAAWLGSLKQRAGTGPLFSLGHSEGALIATLATEKTPVAGLILVAGPGFSFGNLLRRQLDAAGLPPLERARAENFLVEIEAGKTVPDVPPEWHWLLRPSVQPYLISLTRHDPAAALARNPTPALVVQGTTDIQISEADARQLAESRAGVRLALIDGMNHVLKTAPEDRAANIAAYNDPTLPIRPELVDLVAGFIRETAR